jgi:hypothetical protein
MTLNEFIRQYAIKPADAIIMKKKLFGMADHYVIYLGVHNNNHTFVANYTKGVRVINNDDLKHFLSYLVPTDIDRFNGNEYERSNALRRAWSRVGEKAYNYLENNCEHFKNWVHRGENKSDQAENFIKGATVLLGTVVVVGLLAAIFGSE